MAVKIQPTKKVPAKKIAVASVQKNKSISFDEEGNVIDEQETVKKSVKTPVVKKTVEKKTITSKEKRETAHGTSVAMLIGQNHTDAEIVDTIGKKFGEDVAAKYKKWLPINRCDINAGRIGAKAAEAAGVNLPIVRLVRVSGKLVPAESIPKEEKKPAAKKIVLPAVKAPAKKIAVKKATKK